MNKNIMLAWAEDYVFNHEFSVIPINFDKKPTIPWIAYQKRLPTQQELENWFADGSKAGIGIITGKISNIIVIDVDSKKGETNIIPYINDIDKLKEDQPKHPVVYTPTKKGYHIYLRHPKFDVPNGRNVPEGCDLRGDGGYVVAPPTKFPTGLYEWKRPINKSEWFFPSEKYINLIKTNNKYEMSHNDLKTTSERPQTASSVSFKTGSRDDDLFHVANCLTRGGMNDENIKETLSFLAKNCEPPFSPKEAEIKIISALKRDTDRKRNLSEEVSYFITNSRGFFTAQEIDIELGLSDRLEKKNRSRILLRMIDKKIIERKKDKNNTFRTINKEMEEIDFLNVAGSSVDIWLPFGLHNMVEILPGNIILLAGAPNSGKTAFMMNIIRENMNKFDVHYFNSEMGALELQKRLLKQGTDLSEWKFKAWARDQDFHDVIKSGPDKLNIIDYLEIYNEFYSISGKINDIHNALDGGIAIICLQKNPNSELGLGGTRTIEKPRLALALDANILKVIKAKNWKNGINPNSKEINFKLVDGIKIIEDRNGWTQPTGLFEAWSKTK